jgi:hypothetical protein
MAAGARRPRARGRRRVPWEELSARWQVRAGAAMARMAVVGAASDEGRKPWVAMAGWVTLGRVAPHVLIK